ncbi:MarR family winged helix-turn-helix transcriptional regulator [Actinomadura terrae]|uniref:MarR family winged helix-turn-helix transcriptional regulator n=1 Tax=Actinomadura terrae TaxID=604353 RepID=UPI001FA7C14E|nr:MarR family winged helix-turn-helix transcriptional regulator [Actinomadura terrae]
MDTRQLGFGDLTGLGPIEQWPVGRLFALASRMSGPVVSRLIERHGVSPVGFFTLRMLLAEDGLRAGEIAKRMLITPASATSVVDTLERNGHVERRRSESDRRAVLVYITEEGRRLLVEKGPPIGRDLWHLYDVVDEPDAPAVRRFLVNLIKRFEEYPVAIPEDRPEAKGDGA